MLERNTAFEGSYELLSRLNSHVAEVLYIAEETIPAACQRERVKIKGKPLSLEGGGLRLSGN